MSICTNNLFERYWRQQQNQTVAPRLPIGYTEVDAIWNDYAWIDTGLLVDPSDEWIVTCRRTGTTDNCPVIGGGYSKTDSNMALWLNAATNLVEFTYGDGGNSSYKVTTTDYNVSEFHTYRMKLSTGESWIDGNYIGRPTNVSSVPHPKTLALFGCWRGSAIMGGKFPGAVKEAIIIRNGVKVRHFIPYVQFSNNTSGFYDLCATPSGTQFYALNKGYWINYDVTWTVEVDSEDLEYGFKFQNDFYSFTVDWGDGTVNTMTELHQNKTYTHTYQNAGTYTVSLNAPYANIDLKLGGSDQEYRTKIRRLLSYSPSFIPFMFAAGAGSLTMSDKVIKHCTYISNYAFNYCSNLQLSRLPSGLSQINGNTFAYCSSLVVTKLPPGITLIMAGGFQYGNGVTLTELPSGLTELRGYSFEGCTNLALKKLPEGLTSMGEAAFKNCPNITLTSLPSGITALPQQVFYGCTKLALTSIPSAITSIGTKAFYNCTGLTDLTFLGTPTSIASDAFQGCTNLTEIKVPWSEGDVADAPWGATNAVLVYDYHGES